MKIDFFDLLKAIIISLFFCSLGFSQEILSPTDSSIPVDSLITSQSIPDSNLAISNSDFAISENLTPATIDANVDENQTASEKSKKKSQNINYKKILGIVAFAAGVGLEVYAGATYGKAGDKADNYQPVSEVQAELQKDEIRKLEKRSTIAGVIGGVLIAGSVVLFVF